MPHTHMFLRTHALRSFGWSFSLVAFALAMLFPASFAIAQEQVTLKIQPTMIEEKIEPGVTLTRVVSVTNLSGKTQTLYPISRDIVGLGPDGRPVYSTEKKDKEGLALSSWLSYAESSLEIGPGSTGQLHVTIRVPETAGPGSHFGGVFLTYTPPEETGVGTGVGYEIGSIVNLQIAGEIVENLRLRSFLSSKQVYGEPKAHFTARVENLGNVFERPRGLIEITNMFGKKVETVLLNDDGAGVLPGDSRSFEASWAPEGLQVGKYTAVASLSYGAPAQTISSKSEFWILPMSVLMPMLGGILFFVIVLYILLRLYVRRQIALAGGGSRRVSSRREAQGLSSLASLVIAVLIAIILGLLVLFVYFG